MHLGRYWRGRGLSFVLITLLTLHASSPWRAETTTIAISGQIAPDGNGAFASFGTPAINASGQAAFVGGFTGTSGASTDDQGVFRGSE